MLFIIVYFLEMRGWEQPQEAIPGIPSSRQADMRPAETNWCLFCLSWSLLRKEAVNSFLLTHGLSTELRIPGLGEEFLDRAEFRVKLPRVFLPHVSLLPSCYSLPSICNLATLALLLCAAMTCLHPLYPPLIGLALLLLRAINFCSPKVGEYSKEESTEVWAVR